MANTRRLLARRVSVGGKWYGPGPVPEDIAAKITNPKAWMAEHEATEEVAEVFDRVPGTSSGARLARRVNVDGRWFGPGSEIPDDIAAKIRNPKAWVDGVMPDLYDKGGILPAGLTAEVKWADEGGATGEQAPEQGDGAETGEQPATDPETPEAKAPKKAAAKK